MTGLADDPFAVAAALGLRVPASVLVRDAAEAAHADLSALGPRLVVKAQAPALVHKTEAGAVVFVDAADAAAAVGAMQRRLAGHALQGVRLFEHVEHSRELGRELLLGLRWTDDFGPVVTLAAGGVHAEHLARALRPGADLAILSPALPDAAAREAAVRATAVGPLLLDGLRGQPPLLGREALAALLQHALDFAQAHMPHDLLDFEVNPLVVTPRGLFALDARATPGRAEPAPPPPRPLRQVARLLRPRTLAIAGVSARRNPGRIILENVLAEGFDPAAIRLVKPGARELDGIACVPSVDALDPPADLLVLAVDAAAGVEAVEQACAGGRAASIVLIPGGLGEREGTEGLAGRLRAALDAARARPDGGPVLNGGNCLGLRSGPGRYDTLFIPAAKLGRPPRDRRPPQAPLALVSQSGAFACARVTAWAGIEPRYVLSIGNQADLTFGDWLECLRDDPACEVIACYVEGFRPLDGARFVRAAAELSRAGRDVIVYRAARTDAGAGAAASHTASLAGDFAVLRALAAQAGVVLADSLADFDDLVTTFTRLRGREPGALRLGAVSNAGFECVAIADALGPLALADFAPATRARLAALLEGARLSGIVAPRNPLDTTPLLGDEAFVAAFEAVLDDPGVDLGLLGAVPMSPALATLPPGPGHVEDLDAPGALAPRLAALAARSRKPWACVVDAGPAYDPLRARLAATGVPVFRTADRALRLLGTWARRRRAAVTARR